MTQLTGPQVAFLCLAEGLSPDACVIAVAIAKRESGWRTEAHNPNRATGDNSYGLWQINMIDTLGPARRKTYGLTSNEQLLDGKPNARVMASMSGRGTNWGPWNGAAGNWRSGLNMDEAQKAVMAAGIAIGSGGGVPGLTPAGKAAGEATEEAVGAVVGGVGDAISAVPDFLRLISSAELWRRVLLIMVGFGLATIGLLIVARDAIAGAVPVPIPAVG